MDIKQALKDKGMTMEDLARKIGVSQMAVWRWANGKSKPHKIFAKKIDTILGKK